MIADKRSETYRILAAKAGKTVSREELIDWHKRIEIERIERTVNNRMRDDNRTKKERLSV
jgi:hypothetical protein